MILDEYFVWEYPAWVNVVAVTDDDRLVMVRQYRHGLGRVAFEIPAGVVDATDPDPESAARRELLEETGYGGGRWSFLLTCSANPGTHNNLTHSFLAVGVERLADATPDATEDLSVELIAACDARTLVLSGEIVQALHLAPLLKYFLSRDDRQNRFQP